MLALSALVLVSLILLTIAPAVCLALGLGWYRGPAVSLDAADDEARRILLLKPARPLRSVAT